MPTSSRKLTTPPPSVTPLAVSAREACRLLSIGMYHLYALMRSGEIRSFHCGQARRITVASIHDYIARQLAANDGKWRQIKYRRQGLKARQEQQVTKPAALPKRRTRVNQQQLFTE